MAFNERTKGSVPNVKRAMREGAAGRAAVQRKVAAQSRGTVGTQLAAANKKRGLK